MEAKIERNKDFKYEFLDSKSHCISGGDSTNPSWEEYFDGWEKEFQPYIAAIKEVLIESNLVGISASDICNDIWFSFEDGNKVSFTWRAWGDLMQAIIDKREGYMKYYC